jgi:hypothetical protein
MYSDTQIDAAVAAGAISADAAAALRVHVQGLQTAPMADEENFRLISGFNDIFVAIAGILVLVGGAWLGSAVFAGLGAAAVAALAWGMAEYFTLRRRMALPSILFLLAFVGGVFMTVAVLVGVGFSSYSESSTEALFLAVAAAASAVAAFLHWKRFKVPITVAAGATSLGGIVVFLIVAAVPKADNFIVWIFFLFGLALFAFAMRWDMQDPARQTRKSDVAFWLHLAAAPMIVHPIFVSLGMRSSEPSALAALAVLGIYVLIGAIALIVDRRALMVSALSYVLFAVIALFQQFGMVDLNVAIAILVIGSGLLLLSAFWNKMRGLLLPLVPAGWREKLPAVH